MFIGVFAILEFRKDPPKKVRTVPQSLVESCEVQPEFFSIASPVLLARTLHCATCFSLTEDM